MSLTAQAEQLTDAHRTAQARLGAETAVLLLRTWRLLDATDLDRSSREWLSVALGIVERQHGRSARMAATYLRTHRTLELGVLGVPLGEIMDFAPVLAEPVRDRIATSLLVTGPVRAKALMAGGMRIQQAIQQAGPIMAGAGYRQAIEGGRGTLTETTANDPRAVGWQRVASPICCPFCLMLTSRGPVYGSEETASFEAHDHCGCTAEPVYSRDTPWTAQASAARDAWQVATEGANGPQESLNAFRRYVQGERVAANNADE